MIRIGLTGPSGTGKSTLTELALKLGYFVIDCDKVAAEVREAPKTVEAIKKVFPKAVKDGKIDKTALALLAFESKESTEKLNSVILPLIVGEMETRIETANKKGFSHCLLDAPTLYESGADKDCDAVIAVLAKEEIRKERIKNRDGIEGELLEKRLNAAKPDSFYIKKAEYIIYNNGSKEEFIAAATDILAREKKNDN